MLIFSYYIDNKVDKAWFDSSNVFYAECDESDTEFKTVRVTFKNGTVYRYDNVLVYDWTKFKNGESQGKLLNEIFKKGGYKYEKIGSVNIDDLKEEYAFRSGKGYTLYVKGNNELLLVDFKDSLKYRMAFPGDDVVNDIKSMLESIGNVVRVKELSDEEDFD